MRAGKGILCLLAKEHLHLAVALFSWKGVNMALGRIKEMPEIAGERIIIRKLVLSDVKDIYQNIRDREIVKWTLRIPYPYRKEDAVGFVRKTRYSIRKGKDYVFGIALKGKNKVIGIIELAKINYSDGNAEIGYWLGRRFWNRGIMTDAVKSILKFGFRRLNLHRINAALFEENIASRRVLEKSGFKLEGKIKESRFRYGKWRNELRYGILSSEYKRR